MRIRTQRAKRNVTPAIKASSNIEVKHFSHLIFMPFRIARADTYLSQAPASFDELDRFLTTDTTSRWQFGSAPHHASSFDPFSDASAETTAAGDLWGPLNQAQAHAYFHPFVRQFLFDSEHHPKYFKNPNDYRRTYHRGDFNEIHVELNLPYQAPPEEGVITFVVRRCELDLFQAGLGVLTLELASQVPITLRAVLAAQNQIRRTYTSFFNAYTETKIIDTPAGSHVLKAFDLRLDATVIRRSSPNAPLDSDTFKAWANQHVDDRFATEICNNKKQYKARMPDALPLTEVWRHLLQPFETAVCGHDHCFRFVPLGDDRLPTQSYIATNDIAHISRGDWVRLTFCDAPGFDRLPYSKRFLENFEYEYCYDRYWYEGESADSGDTPSRILCSGGHMAWVGRADCNIFFNNATNGALATFRTIYSRLGLLAHLQKGALVIASAKISELSEREYTQKLPPNFENKRDQILRFYSEFLEFTHVYWFDEVTPQMQGIELFNMWQKHLGTRALYTEVRQELIDLVAMINAQEVKNAGRRVEQLTWATVGIGAAAILAATLLVDLNVVSIVKELFHEDAKVVVASGLTAITICISAVLILALSIFKMWQKK